jgi:L-lactate dehydrogenase
MKVSIIGSGFVGSTTAYALVLRRVVSDVLLVDIDAERAQAEASDILHAVPFVHAVNVSAADYADVVGSDVVIITAGVSQKPGESRLELLQRNAKVFQSVVPSVLEHAPDAILLVATNPVDVMTHLAAEYAAAFDVPPARVIGSGTTLDTARFRALLGQHLGVDAQHVHGYVVGEHGDSEVLTWSIVDIGGLPLPEYVARRGLSLDATKRRAIDDQVRNAAYHIIEGKGATYYGIGAALARIVDVMAHDHRSILTLCTPTDNIAGVENVTVSLPRLLGGHGLIDTLPLSLNDVETQALHDSARAIRDILDELED